MSVLIRLVWKEYRMLRGFWVALATFGLVCDGLVILFVSSPQDGLPGLFALVGILPACFALGAGATLFALEREESTRELLQYLPLTWRWIFTSKVSVALSGTLLLALVLLGTGLGGAWFAFGKSIDEGLAQEGAWREPAQIAAIYAVVVIQALGWSVLFSLSSARPLLAAVLGAAGALACLGLVQLSVLHLDQVAPRRFFVVLVAHLAAAAAVWLVDLRLASTWLHGRRSRVRRKRTVEATPRKGLFWQEWRSSRGLLAALLALGLLLTVIQWADPTFVGAGVVPAVGVILALLGACTFLSDQERSQFRFFAERGVSGRTVWFNRLIFWAGGASVLAAVLLVAHLLMVPLGVPQLVQSLSSTSWNYARYSLSWFGVEIGPPGTGRHGWTIHWMRGISGYAVWLSLAFGAGQLCSMFFRSGLLAAVFGVMLAGGLIAWAALMHLLSIGWWWSVAPLVASLFAATWLRSDGWVIERRRLDAWLPSALALSLPAAMVLAAVPVYRVLEIPEVDIDSWGARTQPSVSDEENDAVYHFLSACGRLPSPRWIDFQSLTESVPPEDQKWLAENHDALNAVMEALSRLPADTTLQGIPPVKTTNLHQIAEILLRYGQVAEADGKLDEAWSRYRAVVDFARFARRRSSVLGEALGDSMERDVLRQLVRWGAKKAQTTERLRAVVAALQQLDAQDELLAEVVWRDYRQNLARVSGVQARPQDADAIYELLAKRAAWEFSRARRLLRYTASLDIQDAQAADTAFAAGTIVRTASLDSDRARANLLLQTTLLQEPIPIQGIIEARRMTLCCRRATRLALAAECWRLQHGELPEKLDELAQDFGPLRPDPYSGRPFMWFPFGLRADLRTKYVPSVPAGTPLLYCPREPSLGASGPERIEPLRRRTADDPVGGAPTLEPPDGARVDRQFTSFDGLAFPIPRTAAE